MLYDQRHMELTEKDLDTLELIRDLQGLRATQENTGHLERLAYMGFVERTQSIPSTYTLTANGENALTAKRG